MNGTGLMPRLGEAGPEERTTCMSDSEYRTVEQAQQVFTGYARKFEGMLAKREIRFSISISKVRLSERKVARMRRPGRGAVTF